MQSTCNFTLNLLNSFLTVQQLMGLAVYNSIILDIRFPPCCYKKLLSPAVVPFHDPHATVGIAPLGLKDLMEAMPVSFRGASFSKGL